MKKKFVIILISLLFITFSCGQKNNAAPMGEWTADYDAALQLAKQENIPVFLNFTGSDWCVWCQLMEENVFNKPQWDEFAKDNLILVTLDFPKDKSKISEAYQTRNSKLQAEMGVRGYPTYIILEPNGKTKLGQLSAGKEKTAESFISEVKAVLRYSSKGILKFSASLSGTKGETYTNLWKSYRKVEEEFQSWLATKPAQSAESMQKMEGYGHELSSINKKIKEIEIEKITNSLPDNEAEKYKTLVTKFESVQNDLNGWLATEPQRNEENTKIYSGYQSAIQEVQAEINAIEGVFF